MELSRTEYPSMLAALQPAQAVDVLNDRIRHVGKLNGEVADWLAERRRVEEQYAQGLRRLAQKRPPDSSSDMGIFTAPWQKLVGSADTLAESHHLLAAKIEADIERPLRNFASQNREMQAMSTISGNLAAMAKEIDNAQKKADKVATKGGKASTEKAAGAASEVENANAQWDSQAPYVFEKLQAVDESRLNNLRDILTQFQTHEVDQVERSRVAAEDCLNSLLTLETADEIKMFSIRATQGRPRLGSTTRERRRTLPGNTAPVNLTEMPPPPLPVQRSQDDNALTQTLSPPQMAPDAASERSESIEPERERKRSGFGGGLKRIGTVLGRTPKKDKNKSKRESVRPDLPERSSSGNLASTFSSLGGRVKSRGRDSVMPPPAEEDELPSEAPTPMRERDEPPLPVPPQNINGTSQDVDDVSAAPRVNGTSSRAPTFDQEPLQPSSAVSNAPQLPEPARDVEGFSIAPPANDAISQAQQEAAAASGAVPPGGEPALRLDIRNAPIQEEGDSSAAFNNIANTLRASAPPPSRKLGTQRGRRDVRNTIFVPTPETSALGSNLPPEPAPSSAPLPVPGASSPPSSLQSSPFKGVIPGRFAPGGDDATASDAQSVRSGRSLASTASAIRHPELNEPGLNASVIESVSATFENGTVTRAMIAGEVALAYNATGPASSSESIRLDNFAVLEKVAPNPACIEKVFDKDGYYNIQTSQIARTTVAFKYQVHQDSPLALAKHVPLLLTPQWKVEATQTSAIVNYSINPEFAAALGTASDSLSFANVAIMLHLDPSGPKASTAKAANGGTFLRERSAVLWRLGDVSLDVNSGPKQLRARFFTDGEAKPGSAEGRWELVGGQGVRVGSGLDVSVLEGSSGQKTNGESDPFADEDAVPAAAAGETWKPVKGVKALRSGSTFTAT